MLQNKQISIDHHNRFIKRVIFSKTIQGLKSEQGWAISPSNEYDDREVMPFWSDRAYAARLAKEEWKNYTGWVFDAFIDYQ